MAGEDYLNIRIENCVEHRDGGTTRIAENGVDAFAFEAFDNHFGTAKSLVCHNFSYLKEDYLLVFAKKYRRFFLKWQWILLQKLKNCSIFL
jgi:hypothetical protein